MQAERWSWRKCYFYLISMSIGSNFSWFRSKTICIFDGLNRIDQTSRWWITCNIPYLVALHHSQQPSKRNGTTSIQVLLVINVTTKIRFSNILTFTIKKESQTRRFRIETWQLPRSHSQLIDMQFAYGKLFFIIRIEAHKQHIEEQKKWKICDHASVPFLNARQSKRGCDCDSCEFAWIKTF